MEGGPQEQGGAPSSPRSGRCQRTAGRFTTHIRDTSPKGRLSLSTTSSICAKPEIRGFAGTWQSTSEVFVSPYEIQIQPYQGDGFSS